MKGIYYDSPLGRMWLVEDGTGLCGVWFVGQKYYAEGAEEVQEEKTVVLQETVQWLDSYFSGQKPELLPPLHLKGSPFQKEVWDLLKEIPYGRTTTYGKLAARLAERRGIAHMSAQAVGGAVGHNPVSILVPCHRVIGSNGSLTGYAGGMERKRWLLEREGVDTSVFFMS